MEENLDLNDKVSNEISDNSNKSKSEVIKNSESEKDKNINANNAQPQISSVPKVEIKNENDPTTKTIPKLKKELPIEKKPFEEFINKTLT